MMRRYLVLVGILFFTLPSIVEAGYSVQYEVDVGTQNEEPMPWNQIFYTDNNFTGTPGFSNANYMKIRPYIESTDDANWYRIKVCTNLYWTGSVWDCLAGAIIGQSLSYDMEYISNNTDAQGYFQFDFEHGWTFDYSPTNAGLFFYLERGGGEYTTNGLFVVEDNPNSAVDIYKIRRSTQQFSGDVYVMSAIIGTDDSIIPLVTHITDLSPGGRVAADGDHGITMSSTAYLSEYDLNSWPSTDALVIRYKLFPGGGNIAVMFDEYISTSPYVSTLEPGYYQTSIPVKQLEAGEYQLYAELQRIQAFTGVRTTVSRTETNFIYFDMPATSTPLYSDLDEWFGSFSTTTASTTESNFIECNTLNAFYARWTCDALTFVFVPPKTTITKFTSLYNRLTQLPPFSWVATINNSMAGLNSATSTPMSQESGAYYAIPGALNMIVPPIRSALSYAVWVVGFLVVLQMVRKTQF